MEIVEDAAVSGRDLHRPGMELVLRALQARRVDTLVVAKLDRLGHSLLDVAGLIDQAARQGWALVALDVGVDTGSLTGKAMAGMMAVFAELERGLIGQRTRDALRAARERGTVLGRPRVLRDDVIERIARERAAGASLRAIAQRLDGVPTAHGARRWQVSAIQSALRTAARHVPPKPGECRRGMGAMGSADARGFGDDAGSGYPVTAPSGVRATVCGDVKRRVRGGDARARR